MRDPDFTTDSFRNQPQPEFFDPARISGTPRDVLKLLADKRRSGKKRRFRTRRPKAGDLIAPTLPSNGKGKKMPRNRTRPPKADVFPFGLFTDGPKGDGPFAFDDLAKKAKRRAKRAARGGRKSFALIAEDLRSFVDQASQSANEANKASNRAFASLPSIRRQDTFFGRGTRFRGFGGFDDGFSALELAVLGIAAFGVWQLIKR